MRERLDPPTIEGYAIERLSIRERLRRLKMKFEKQIRWFKMMCIACFFVEGFAAGGHVLLMVIYSKLPENDCQLTTPGSRAWGLAVATATLVGGTWLMYDLVRWWLDNSEKFDI